MSPKVKVRETIWAGLWLGYLPLMAMLGALILVFISETTEGYLTEQQVTLLEPYLLMAQPYMHQVRDHFVNGGKLSEWNSIVRLFFLAHLPFIIYLALAIPAYIIWRISGLYEQAKFNSATRAYSKKLLDSKISPKIRLLACLLFAGFIFVYRNYVLGPSFDLNDSFENIQSQLVYHAYSLVLFLGGMLILGIFVGITLFVASVHSSAAFYKTRIEEHFGL